MFEPYFIKVHYGCFPVGSQEKFRTPVLKNNSELLLRNQKGRQKYWSSFVMFQLRITETFQKNQSSDFFHFCQKFLLGFTFRVLCLKNIFDQEKATKIQLLLEKKEFFLKKPRSVLQKCVLQFSNNKTKLSKLLQKISPKNSLL